MNINTILHPAKIGVLVVDDDIAFRTMMTMVLEDAEWDVLEASDGSEALATLRANLRRLVVLLDGRLPGMSGEDVLRAVKADPGLMARHAYVLVSGSTATPSPPLTALLRELRALVLAKPFSIDELLDAVQTQARRLGEEEVAC
jgi:CheY-like chemotaxis protein